MILYGLVGEFRLFARYWRDKSKILVTRSNTLTTELYFRSCDSIPLISVASGPILYRIKLMRYTETHSTSGSQFRQTGTPFARAVNVMGVEWRTRLSTRRWISILTCLKIAYGDRYLCIFYENHSPYIRSFETDFHNSMFYGNVSSCVYRTMLIYAQVPVSRSIKHTN